MSALTVSIPEHMREFVESEAAAGGFESADAFVQEVIRALQRRKAEARLEALLLEGLNSPSEEVSAEWWDAFRAELRARPVPGSAP